MMLDSFCCVAQSNTTHARCTCIACLDAWMDNCLVVPSVQWWMFALGSFCLLVVLACYLVVLVFVGPCSSGTVTHSAQQKCMKSVDAAIMQCAAIRSLLFHQHSSKFIKICPSEHCKALTSSNAAAVPVAAMQSGRAGTGHAWLHGRALPKTSADV
jgi:hypothetical protein